MTTKSLTAVLVTITIAITITIAAGQGTGQATTPSCAEKLTGCFTYLNGTTTPPAACCTPLKDAVTNQKECLCDLYKNPVLLKGLGVNITQALNLPTRCNIPTHTAPADFCKGVAPSGSPSSTSTTPTGGTGSGSAATITGTGFVFGLLMFVTYVVVY
ncbi:non-specific lipid transfer protein GPI-anchored 3-like [Silene latifolia]|uniref:non-specific lipid transfer protein GPI-anchored 3-like n=1 Tax=Silene latifolia TaxID=37657 RepID=UPI003D785EFC